MRVLWACCITLVLTTGAYARMGLSFEWGPTQKCFDPKSPPMSLSGVPKDTESLDIRMVDLDATGYPHGGGKVAYQGQKSLAYGAFTYKGPCPPKPHRYQFTAKAIDASGKVLATATARSKFPE